MKKTKLLLQALITEIHEHIKILENENVRLNTKISSNDNEIKESINELNDYTESLNKLGESNV